MADSLVGSLNMKVFPSFQFTNPPLLNLFLTNHAGSSHRHCWPHLVTLPSLGLSYDRVGVHMFRLKEWIILRINTTIFVVISNNQDLC